MVKPIGSGKLSPAIDSFMCSEVDRAPVGPGLYAWYSVLGIGPRDWELDVENGCDAGINRLRHALEAHTGRHHPQPMRVEARGAFSQYWGGLAEELSGRALQAALRGIASNQPDSDVETSVPHLSLSLERPDLRRVLVTLLHAATPILSSPLYIGVTDGLQGRLKKHASSVMKLSHHVGSSAERRSKLLEKARTSPKFSIRAVAAGFSPETLVVWTLDLNTLLHPEAIKTSDARAVAGTAEWLLNRWFHPAFGKR